MRQRTRFSAADLLDTIDLPDLPCTPLGKFRAPYRPIRSEQGRYMMLPIVGRQGQLQIPPDAKETVYER